MGVSIAVLIVDWEHIESVPDNLRYELLADAAFPDDGEEWPPPLAAEPDNRRNEASRDTALTHGDGWTWPTATEPCWCGVYEFRGTLGSYKAHFWAGERWEEIRSLAEPELRTAVDRFISRLFWDGLEYMPDTNGDGVPVRSSEWPSAKGHLLWCPPGEVGALQALWTAAAPELHVLREPFVQHARADFGWINDFESFAELLTGWGDVVGEADRRGWGIIGLRC